jgi:hypothetical protein
MLFWLAFGRQRVMEELTTTLLYAGGAILTALVLAGFRIIRCAYRIHLEDLANIGRVERARDDLLAKLHNTETRPANAPVVLLEFPGWIWWPDGPYKKAKQEAPTLRTIEGVVLDARIRSISKGIWTQMFSGLLTVSTVPQAICVSTIKYARERKPSDKGIDALGDGFMLEGTLQGILEIVAMKHEERKSVPVEIPILLTYRTATGHQYGTHLTLQFSLNPRDPVPPDHFAIGALPSVRYDKTELIQGGKELEEAWV